MEMEMEAALVDLELAEEEIFRAISLASMTCEVLHSAPLCNYESLKELSSEYSNSITNTYNLVSKHLHILKTSPPTKSLLNYTYELDKIEAELRDAQKSEEKGIQSLNHASS